MPGHTFGDEVTLIADTLEPHAACRELGWAPFAGNDGTGKLHIPRKTLHSGFGGRYLLQ
jgi:hypothetical protein